MKPYKKTSKLVENKPTNKDFGVSDAMRYNYNTDEYKSHAYTEE